MANELHLKEDKQLQMQNEIKRRQQKLIQQQKLKEQKLREEKQRLEQLQAEKQRVEVIEESAECTP